MAELATAFLDAEAKKPGARRTESGIVITDIEVGTGDQPTKQDTVVAHYHGTLRDGSVFDSSRDRGEPFEMLKFRTMRSPVEGEDNSDASRLTPRGRWLREASIDELPALKERLLAHGAELIDPIRETPFERFFFREPNGYIFEMVSANREPEA